MSANTSITEGNVPRFFGPVDYLRVASGSGQYALWVPESERALTTKSIDKNGIYRASDDGAYGWSSVSVNVPAPDSVTGKDGDGDEVVVKPDPDTGVLEEEKVPSSIEVITPPTKLTYNEGQAIDFTGAVVKAYYETGGEWGTVPNEEITINPTTAHTDEAPSATSDLDTGAFTQPIPLTGVITFAGTYRGGYHPYRFTTTWTPVGNAVLVAMKNTASTTKILYASKDSEDALLEKHVGIDLETSEQSTQFSTYGTNLSYTKDNKTVYYSTLTAGHVSNYEDMVITPSVNNYGSDADLAKAAWTAVYGEITGGTQTITVSWPRPGDGAILETTFDITVQQSFGGVSGGGGQAGETGAGRND